MIFSGDLIYPKKATENTPKCSSNFWDIPKFVNLEASIKLNEARKLTNGIALQSNTSVIDFMKDINVVGVTCANNHIFDFDIDINQQKRFLNKHGISVAGAGSNLSEAAKPIYFEEQNIVVIAFGWNVISCKYATATKPGVNPYEYPWVESIVNKTRQTYPDAMLVCVFHWNYEFEAYPQPADREFSMHLIDCGVDAIIGHHAHIIQGFEYYKNKPIFYGVGNMYFPNASFGDFKMSFPEVTKTGLSIDLTSNGAQAYITRLIDNEKLLIVEEGLPQNISLLSELSKFQGMSNKDYIHFFKKNRAKKKLLPIYKSYKNSFKNYLNDKFVMSRQIPIDLLVKIKGAR